MIEVLVALTILSIAMTALIAVIATGLDRQRQARDETTAMSLARSLLEQAERSQTPQADDSGAFSNGFSWRRQSVPYGSATDQQAWPVTAERVTITISWANRTRSLSTLRLLPKPVPQP